MLICLNTYDCIESDKKPISNKESSVKSSNSDIKTLKNDNNNSEKNKELNSSISTEKKSVINNNATINRVVEIKPIQAKTIKEFSQKTEKMLNDLTNQQKKAWFPGRKKELFEDLKDKQNFVDPVMTTKLKAKEEQLKITPSVELVKYRSHNDKLGSTTKVGPENQLLNGANTRTKQENEKVRSFNTADKMLNENRIKSINFKLKKKINIDKKVKDKKVSKPEINKPTQSSVKFKNESKSQKNNATALKANNTQNKVIQTQNKISTTKSDNSNLKLIRKLEEVKSPTVKIINEKDANKLNKVKNDNKPKLENKMSKNSPALKLKKASRLNLKKRILKNKILKKLDRKAILPDNLYLGKSEVMNKVNISKNTQKHSNTRSKLNDSSLLNKRKLHKQALKAFRRMNQSYSEMKDLVQQYLKL